ncbi:hypothetical protein VC218_19660 [Xanthomonas nasturtii]|uniref:DUF6630 family protein n=1 Tax=Xanthomonas nasturtii TaxID=1843581 RepID=UPI002B232678|nr:hypothetical protein [Xanthomonas nasturtii]MEA9581031.1 hypothetical protein [Xanthomonas nasturtii]
MSQFFLRMMRALLGSGTVPRYGVEVSESEAHFDEEVILSKRQIACLRKLVKLLATRLGAKRAEAIASQASQAFSRNDDVPMAFASGTNLGAEHPLSIYVDWNGSSEVEWQINRIFEALELPDRWRWTSEGADRSMFSVLRALEQWLYARGYHLWHVKTDGDDALVFPVELEDAALAEQFAKDAGMILFTLAAAEPHYGTAPGSNP